MYRFRAEMICYLDLWKYGVWSVRDSLIINRRGVLLDFRGLTKTHIFTAGLNNVYVSRFIIKFISFFSLFLKMYTDARKKYYLLKIFKILSISVFFFQEKLLLLKRYSTAK